MYKICIIFFFFLSFLSLLSLPCFLPFSVIYLLPTQQTTIASSLRLRNHHSLTPSPSASLRRPPPPASLRLPPPPEMGQFSVQPPCPLTPCCNRHVLNVTTPSEPPPSIVNYDASSGWISGCLRSGRLVVSDPFFTSLWKRSFYSDSIFMVEM
ncbi:hypothetical protein MtrunA17_Chr6g0483711 [Medicago truncatula]|uniref:Uncharacterized protein n=1 Tax=Medicago truncatula TaxID=3880 RepID=A0A396HN00_MEDTR|nr:hypothetical protein MtrunA17_Chr6g0483711 [Medicago truncatula]